MPTVVKLELAERAWRLFPNTPKTLQEGSVMNVKGDEVLEEEPGEVAPGVGRGVDRLESCSPGNGDVVVNVAVLVGKLFEVR